MVVPYYWALGPEFREHFFLKESLERVIAEPSVGNQPFYYYVIVMWFDFFPWSVLIPSSLVLLWSVRPFGPRSKELFLLVWILAYFVAFSLAHGKTERYLLPIVPPMGLAIGYFYHSIFSTSGRNIPWERLLKVLLGVFCVVNVVGLIGGPYLLEWLRGRINGCVPFTLYWSDDRVKCVALLASCVFPYPHGGEGIRDSRSWMDAWCYWISIASHGCCGFSQGDVSGNESVAAQP